MFCNVVWTILDNTSQEACILCRCKGPNLPKIVVVLHHHACKDALSQKML
jgi:hypothetical protein